MRKGFEGLDGPGVRDRLLCERMSGHLFLFSNARRNRRQVLYWVVMRVSMRSVRICACEHLSGGRDGRFGAGMSNL